VLIVEDAAPVIAAPPRSGGARITASSGAKVTVTACLFRFSLNRRQQDRCSSQRVRRSIPRAAPASTKLVEPPTRARRWHGIPSHRRRSRRCANTSSH